MGFGRHQPRSKGVGAFPCVHTPESSLQEAGQKLGKMISPKPQTPVKKFFVSQACRQRSNLSQ